MLRALDKLVNREARHWSCCCCWVGPLTRARSLRSRCWVVLVLICVELAKNKKNAALERS